MAELAAIAAVAVVLLLGPARVSTERLRVSVGAVVTIGAAALPVVLVFFPRYGVLIGLVVGTSMGVAWLAGRRREHAQARATSRAVQVVCAELADDLRMGRVPAEAIASAGARWPPLRPVVVAADLHHDVAHALHEVSHLPGADGLRDVAAAWQVSGRAGSGLAEALDQVTGLLAARERRARLIDAELAAARATAMVVSGLPLLVLGMGAGLGTSPWSFFVSGIGTIALALALVLLFLGWAWLDRLMSRTVSGRSAKSRGETADRSPLRLWRLPLAVLAGGAGWAFVGGVAGVIAAVVLVPLAWRTLSNARGPAAVERERRLVADYALVVELLALALSAGADIDSALRMVAAAVGDPWESRLALPLNALDVGQSPAEVWAELERDPTTTGLGRALSRSHATGVPVSDAMRRLATDLRESADLAAHAYARTIEVRAAAPLGVCFLPAFVLLGVVPLVAGVLGDLAWISEP
ncbi:MAG: type II secretion system F family protein [Marmoricola sp.]